MRRPPYSKEEELFIIEQLELYGRPYRRQTWEKIAAAHKQKLNTYGFEQERNPSALIAQFRRMLKRKEGCGLVIVPESVRKIVRNPQLRFSEEENYLIKQELLSSDDSQLQDSEFWDEIVKKIDAQRRLGTTGFVMERQRDAVRKHVRYVMKRKNQIPEAVLKRNPKFLQRKHGGSKRKSSSSTSQQGSSEAQSSHGTRRQSQNMAVDGENGSSDSLDSFIEDLENDPELAADEETSMANFIDDLENDPNLVEHQGESFVNNQEESLESMLHNLESAVDPSFMEEFERENHP